MFLGKVFLELYAQLENFRLTLKSAGQHEKRGWLQPKTQRAQERTREHKRVKESEKEREEQCNATTQVPLLSPRESSTQRRERKTDRLHCECQKKMFTRGKWEKGKGVGWGGPPHISTLVNF